MYKKTKIGIGGEVIEVHYQNALDCDELNEILQKEFPDLAWDFLDDDEVDEVKATNFIRV